MISASVAATSGELARVRSRSSRWRISAARAETPAASVGGGGRGRCRHLLTKSSFPSNFRSGVQKDLYVRVGKDFGPDVAALHDHSAGQTHLALTVDHPGAYARMHGDPRGCFSDVAISDSLGDILAVEKNAVALKRWFQVYVRLCREPE